MKKFFLILCIIMLLLFPFSKTLSQGFGFGERRILRIGNSARHVLYNYLAGDYRQHCTHKRKLPEACWQTKPSYEGMRLPLQGAGPLPASVLKHLGFIEPGTDYAQIGYVIYLVSLPRKIILDAVSIEDE
jgi:hypothetical protein